MQQNRTVQTAVVGLGKFGIKYIQALKTMPSVRLTWVCSQDIADCQKVANEYNIAQFSTRTKDLCNDPYLDVIVVVTPEHAHRDITVQALEAGKHVIVEKPLATEDSDAQDMCDAQERTGKFLMTSFLLRFDYRYAQINQQLAKIGPVRHIHAYRNFDRNIFETACRTHSFIENAIHDIDLILWYTNSPVKNVHAYCRNTMVLSTPDINIGIIEFENGVIATIHTSWLYPRQPVERLQWNAGIQVMGDLGVLEAANDRGGFRANIEGEGISLLDQTGWANIHDEPRGAFGAMLRHYFACIQGQANYVGAQPHEAMNATRIAKALVAAAETS